MKAQKPKRLTQHQFKLLKLYAKGLSKWSIASSGDMSFGELFDIAYSELESYRRAEAKRITLRPTIEEAAAERAVKREAKP